MLLVVISLGVVWLVHGTVQALRKAILGRWVSENLAKNLTNSYGLGVSLNSKEWSCLRVGETYLVLLTGSSSDVIFPFCSLCRCFCRLASIIVCNELQYSTHFWLNIGDPDLNCFNSPHFALANSLQHLWSRGMAFVHQYQLCGLSFYLWKPIVLSNS